jgi:hypothetical protein
MDSVCRLVKSKAARSEWIAAVPFIAIGVVIQAMQSTHPAVEVPRVFLIYLVLAIVLFRFGLVPWAVGVYTVDMLANVPFSADFSAWYATSSLLTRISVERWRDGAFTTPWAENRSGRWKGMRRHTRGLTIYSSSPSLYPISGRAVMFLTNRGETEAAAELQKIIDHRAELSRIHPQQKLSHLQLGCAYIVVGDGV